MSSPDLTQRVLGFRDWGSASGMLHSTGVAGAWGRGHNVAQCQHTESSSYGLIFSFGTGTKKHDEPAPANGCVCGLYAMHEPKPNWLGDPPWSPPPNIPGAIAAWGRMEIHKTGFRAQYAEIIALGFHPQSPVGYIDHVGKIAEGYAVPAIPVDDLMEFGMGLASPIPTVLLPDEPEAKPGELNEELRTERAA